MRTFNADFPQKRQETAFALKNNSWQSPLDSLLQEWYIYSNSG